jgi:hypothetical protein
MKSRDMALGIRVGGRSLDQLIAFSIVEDHDRQEAVFEQLALIMSPA